MEIRKRNLTITENKGGARVVRVGLPAAFADALEATKNDKEVFLYQVGDEVIISKRKKNMLELVELAMKEIDLIAEQQGFILDVALQEYIDYIAEVEAKDEDEDEVTDSFYRLIFEKYESKKIGNNYGDCELIFRRKNEGD